MWKPQMNVDYSKYYNRKVKIYYIDDYGNDEKYNFIEGILCSKTTNEKGLTTVSIKRNCIHPYEQYQYVYRTSICDNIIKKIYILEPEIKKTIFDLSNEKLFQELGNEINKYVEPYIEI